jgi:hypothetical protein
MPSPEQVQYFDDTLVLARSYAVSNPSNADCARAALATTEATMERSGYLDFVTAYGGREALLLQLAGAMMVAP